MRIINRHYFFQLMMATIISTLVLLSILLYGNLIKHDDYLMQAMSISPKTFLKLSSLLIPYALSFALPLGFIIALLLCYGKWSSSYEIIALRSLGVGMFSWGMPCFLLSFLVSVFSIIAFLEWGPKGRKLFDENKSSVIWTNLNSILEKEKEIKFHVDSGVGQKSDQKLSIFSNKLVRDVLISVGSAKDDKWYNLRILLMDKSEKALRVIHSKTADVKKDLKNSKILLFLKNVDIETPGNTDDNSQFVSFDEWSKPLAFNISKSSDNNNLKRQGWNHLYTQSGFKTKRGKEAKILINKGIVLGASSFFLCFVLLPISVMKGSEHYLFNLAIGIFISLIYYVFVILIEYVAFLFSEPSLLWFPIVAVIIIAAYLMYKFNCPK